ncbi:hypothetical protein Egran_03546, partial [Elaphomyces granulatus]
LWRKLHPTNIPFLILSLEPLSLNNKKRRESPSMHSCLSRAQAVFGFYTTVLSCVAGLIALSVLFYPADNVVTTVDLKNVQVTKGRLHYYSTKKEEYAQIRFDLDADLSPLFNWNTKQIFVYVLASYPPSPPGKNLRNSEAIIWDTIIPAPESPYSLAAAWERFSPGKASLSKPRKHKASGSPSSKHPGILRLRNQKHKYQITDISSKLVERGNATLVVGWNVQPWVGALWWSPGTGTVPRTSGKAGRSQPFDFPALKSTKP